MNIYLKHLITGLIFCAIGILISKSCEGVKTEPKTNTINVDSIKQSVKNELSKVAELEKDSKKKDSIVYRWRTNWRTITKHDTLPCDTILNKVIIVGDSLLKADSMALAAKDTIIHSLKKVVNSQQLIIKVDSQMIANKNDSIKIVSKLARKYKRQRNGALVLWGIREGLGVVRR